jgi:guanine nucleotide-binding protein subunit alpha
MVPDIDPLLRFTAPPSRESPAQRAAREEREREAKRRSDSIDEELRQEKVAMKKRDKTVVRVLLLGQAESGE